MNAIRFCKRIDSDTLYLLELKPLIGQTVEIIVLEEPRPGAGDWDAAMEAAGRLKDYDFDAVRSPLHCVA